MSGDQEREPEPMPEDIEWAERNQRWFTDDLRQWWGPQSGRGQK